MIACCKQVIPQNAARMFLNPAPVLKKPRVQRLLRERSNGRAIEIGAGCLRNSLFLLRAGFKITAVDLPGMEDKFPEKYRRFRRQGGTVLLGRLPQKRRFEFGVCTFVIETICEPISRLRLLKEISAMLDEQGFLILSTRGPADVVTAGARGIKCSDGFLTPQRTFVRSFNAAQLTRLLRLAGFRSVELLHKSGTRAPELLHVVAFKVPL
jgi:hypothetical protein